MRKEFLHFATVSSLEFPLKTSLCLLTDTQKKKQNTFKLSLQEILF